MSCYAMKRKIINDDYTIEKMVLNTLYKQDGGKRAQLLSQPRKISFFTYRNTGGNMRGDTSSPLL